MPISIDNDQTEKLAHIQTEIAGEAVSSAVSEPFEKITNSRSGRSLAEELGEIASLCAKRSITSQLSDDEILGYDEIGSPTR